MKKLLIITSIIFVASLILSAIFFTGTDIERTTDRVEFDQTYTFTDVTAIDLSAVSTDISIEKSTSEEVTMHHTGNCVYGQLGRKKDIQEAPEFKAEIIDGKVTAQLNENNFYPFTYFIDCNDKLAITIPEDFTGSLAFDSVSSNINIPNFDLEELEVETVSGRIISEARSTYSNLDSISGDITVTGGDKLSVETVSGNVIIDEITSGSITTISGDVTLRLSDEQSITFDTVSGNIDDNIQISQDAEITIDTVSGNVMRK